MQIYDFLSDVQYQHPLGCTTWGVCKNECGKSARGSRECIACLKARAVKSGKVTAEFFDEYVESIVQERNLTVMLTEAIGEGTEL